MSEENIKQDAEQAEASQELQAEQAAPTEVSATAEPTQEQAEETGMEEPLPLLQQIPSKPPRKISLSAFCFAAVALVLAAVMITFTVCNTVYKKKLAEAKLSQITMGQEGDPFTMMSAILQAYSYYDLDDQELIEKALKAYVAATGDRYAEYYTAEEYLALQQESAGESDGIGVTIIPSEAIVEGASYKVIKIVSATPNSPAQIAGIQAGDMIMWAGIGENAVTVDSLGYTEAVNRLTGKAGTVASFTVLRLLSDGSSYEILPFEITRAKVESLSVYSHVCATDSSVGIVKITGFDAKTPKQFIDAVQELRSAGCTYFVFDVRNNPGGDLKSITAVLSTFLNAGDTVIRLKGKNSAEERITAEVVSYEGNYADCSITAEQIGMFRSLKFAVLCNENTASAAELFTAAIRDYGLGTVVGTTTFGKGTAQSIMSLAYFGIPGGLKLTTRMYFPPLGESYDGVGITPDVTVALSEELKHVNSYEYEDAKDNQLQAAITAIKQ